MGRGQVRWQGGVTVSGTVQGGARDGQTMPKEAMQAWKRRTRRTAGKWDSPSEFSLGCWSASCTRRRAVAGAESTPGLRG